MATFKDNFSKQADVYSKFRPTYPKELFEYLYSLNDEHNLAWDCGTGNGQSAIQLAEFYERVYATDPSENQIKNAVSHEKVSYKIEKAEQTGLGDCSVDLITVAQAVHWFDFDKFYQEVKRVLKPNGVIAVWAYGIPVIEDGLNQLIADFHDNIVGEFWQTENKLIEKEYSTIPFPFDGIEAPTFYTNKQMSMPELLGLLRSWSATQKYIDTYNHNPVDLLHLKISRFWPEESSKKNVNWKLILKVGRHS